MGIMAVIEVDFDPLFGVDELVLRWQTVGIALALLVGIAMAARGRVQTFVARPIREARRRPRYPPAPRVATAGELIEALPLRLDDLGYIVLASVPGAVIGGRLVHGLVFWDAYSASPGSLFDPALGSLSLLGAVIGGALSGAVMARLLAAPVRRWADAAAVPLLVAVGLGKLAQFVGGSGQGVPFGGPWAVAFVGEGPWVSASPELPAHPSQIYEGIWMLLAALLVLSLAAGVRGHAGRSGAMFAAALMAFLIGRILVGFTWRDERLLGPLNAEQLLAIAALLVMVLGLVLAAGFRAWHKRQAVVVKLARPPRA